VKKRNRPVRGRNEQRKIAEVRYRESPDRLVMKLFIILAHSGGFYRENTRMKFVKCSVT
jgi:hypothetical protein